jgi:hypothetical protein
LGGSRNPLNSIKFGLLVLANLKHGGIVGFHEQRPAQLLLLPILELHSIVALV